MYSPSWGARAERLNGPPIFVPQSAGVDRKAYVRFKAKRKYFLVASTRLIHNGLGH